MQTAIRHTCAFTAYSTIYKTTASHTTPLSSINKWLQVNKNFWLHNKHVSPPSVIKNRTRKACSLDRTAVNLWKSATLLRVSNSSILLLRSRGCAMFIMCSLCGIVMHSLLASSARKALWESMISTKWTPLTESLCIRTWSKGRISPYSAPTSAVQITQISLELRRTCTIRSFFKFLVCHQ